MARLNAANNAESVLVSAVNASANVFTVEDASVFPQPPFRLSIGEEIVEVTNVNGNQLTVQRGVEGTVATSHNSGAKIENRMTAGMYNELAPEQKVDELRDEVAAHKADYTQHVNWLGTVGGSGATMTATLDNLTSYVNGLGVSITTNANRTGNLTLNINGLGAIPIKKSSGDNADEMIANSVYTLRYYNGNFILQGEGGVSLPDGWNEEITGRAWEVIAKSDPVVIKKMGVWEDGVSKVDDPNILPPNHGNDVSFSADGNYLAVAHFDSPYLTIYKRNGDTFTKLPNPSSLPTGLTSDAVSFSEDGSYLVVGHSLPPYLTIYKRNGDTFTKLPDPSSLPTSTSLGLTFSSNGNYLAVANSSSPYLTIYKRNGDTFTKLPDPNILPPNQGNDASFSADGNYLAVAHFDSPYLTIYKRNGDTFTKLPNPSSLPSNTGRGTSFSADGNYLAVAHSSSPYLTIYKRNGDTFTKLPNPSSLPSNTGWGTSFSADGNYLAVVHSSSPYLTIYKRNGDTFTKLPDPNILPPNQGNDASFSADGNYLAVAHFDSPYLTIYKSDAYDSIQKITAKNQYFYYSPPEWKLGVAMEDLTVGSTGKVILFPKIYNLPNS